jgi:hypothetical protein
MGDDRWASRSPIKRDFAPRSSPAAISTSSSTTPKRSKSWVKNQRKMGLKGALAERDRAFRKQ